MAALPKARFGDGLFALFGVRLVVWLIAAQAFLPGVLRDPPLNAAYYHDEHNCIMHEEVARLTLARFHEVPVWNPYFCGGIAGIANAPDASLAPDFLLRIVFGTMQGRRLTVLFFVLLGMEGVYRWARRNRASAAGAAAGAVAFACSGYYVELLRVGWVFMFNYQLVPWVCLAFEEGLRKRRWIVLGGGLLAWLVLGGGTYVVPYTGLALAALAVLHTVSALSRRSGDRPADFAPWRPALTLIGMGVVAAGLSAIRLLPMLALMRGHPRPVDQKDLDTPLAVFAMLGLPRDHASWNGSAGAFYVGAIVCALALFALLLADRRGAKFMIVGVMFIAFACGEVHQFAPYVFLHKLPVFSQLRFPNRMTVMAALFVAMAASRGLTRIEDGIAAALRAIALRAGAGVGEGGELAPLPRALVGGAAFAVAFVLARAAAADVTTENMVHERAIYTLAPVAQIDQPFRQSRGNRWDAHVWPFANLGSLHCFEEQQLPVSPLLRGDLPAEEYAAPGSVADVERLSWSPHQIRLRVRSAEGALVRVNQNHNGSWKSDVGEVVSDGGLLAVRLPPGEHVVTLRFRDPFVRVGFVVSAVTVLLILRFGARRLRLRARAWQRMHHGVMRAAARREA